MADITDKRRPEQGETDDVKKVESIDDLHKAAKAGDVNRIKISKLEEIDVNTPNLKGLTALHISCREGNIEVVIELLKKGANIEATTKKRNTPLHVASLGGKLEIVRLLLEHGAEVNKQAENEMTPLYMAAQENHIDVAKELLYHSANPHLAASGGFEPVDVAIQQKHSEMTAFLMEQGSKRGFKALHVIARKDAINAASLLLSNGFDPDIVAPNGYTPLHIAAKYGSTNTALLLIEAGASINTPAKHNITPLHVAAKHGQTEIVSVLIEAGATLDVSTKDGLTPLHCAARDGYEECVELLLVHNASLNAKTKHGLPALHMAAQGNHVDCANHLLGHGCHIDSPTFEGVSPLHVAAHYGNVEISKLLLDRGADVDNQAKNGYTALHVACKKSKEDIVQLLIKYGANVHLKNIHGQTALHIASYFGIVNIVLFLLESEAFIEEKTNRDETSLHIACRTRQIAVVRLLLRNGAKVEPRSKTFGTPLWIACLQGSYDIVSVLLQSGANPDARNKEEATYLHIAARNGNEPVVDCLFDHGAKVDLRNKQHFTPLHEAARYGHAVTARMLIEKNSNVNAEAINNLRPLHLGCLYRHNDVSFLLMENGADLQAATKNGFTPLHILSANNGVDLALQLLSSGVDADGNTRIGISPLHLAAKEGNVTIADALLENGASPGIQTKNGLTPLHLAARFNQLEVSKKLVKYAAPINSQTPSGYTPLHFACFYGHDNIVQLLLEEGANVEAKTRHANTPLHLTALRGFPSITELLLKYNAPANTLNKDGLTALHIAELTESVRITEVLVKVTHAVIRKKEFEPKEDHILKYSAPEEFEEIEVIEITEEADAEAATERLSVNRDFEESFLDFDESSLPDASRCDSIASYKPADIDTSTASVSQGETPEKSTPVIELSPQAVFLSSENSILFENLEEMELPISRGFLASFFVDAKGGIFESKHTGIRVSVPKGACSMPTRITCRPIRNHQKVPMPKLYMNEGLVNRLIEVSPQGMQFLKPITFEVPHFGSLRKRERELLLLRSDPDADFWREHVSTNMSSEGNDVDGFDEVPTSPQHGFKSGLQFVRIVTQIFPERFAIIARPREEKFVMFNDAGSFRSSVLPKVQVVFGENTLNSSLKISLQVQIMDDSILQPDETSQFSSIVRLQPHIKLAIAVTIVMPCPWIDDKSSSGISPNLRLLALMPDKDNGMSENSHWTWEDVTDMCPLSIFEDCCHFQTSFLTTFWLIEDNVPERIPSKAESIYQRVCFLPYEVKFVVYAAVLTSNSAELRVFCMTDDKLEKALEQIEGFVLVGRSGNVEVYDGQTIHLTCNGTVISASRSLKLSFKPFEENRLAFKVAGLNSSGPWNYRLGFISNLRQDADGRVPLLCSLEAVISMKMLRGKIIIPTNFSTHKVSDDLLQIISRNVGAAWKDLATYLLMTDDDVQGIEDLAYGKSEADKAHAEQDRIAWETNPSHTSDKQVLAALTLLELWRSAKGDGASFENLRNALESIGRGDLCDLVECRSPVTLTPRRINSIGDKHDESITLHKGLISKKNVFDRSPIAFSIDAEVGEETNADVNSTTWIEAESGLGAEISSDSTDNFYEETFVEHKIEGGNENDLHELLNSLSGHDDLSGDDYSAILEPEKGEENESHQLHEEDDEKPSTFAYNEFEEEVRRVIPTRDVCTEEQAVEHVIDDVQCRITDEEFGFMNEINEASSDVDSNNLVVNCNTEEEVTVSRDENSNVGSSQGVYASVPVDNGNSNGDTQDSDDVIKRLFAGEQSVLAFFDTPQKTAENNDLNPVTFV